MSPALPFRAQTAANPITRQGGVAGSKGTSSPIGRGLSALASQGAERPRRLGRKGEGLWPLRRGRNPSPFASKLAPLAKRQSPLPMGEEAPPALCDCPAVPARKGFSLCTRGTFDPRPRLHGEVLAARAACLEPRSTPQRTLNRSASNHGEWVRAAAPSMPARASRLAVDRGEHLSMKDWENWGSDGCAGSRRSPRAREPG
jgi:hypothetical protein